MKTDDDSEEAKKPPGNTSGNQKNPVSDANAQKEELQRARRQVPKRAGQSEEPRRGNANPGPAAQAISGVAG